MGQFVSGQHNWWELHIDPNLRCGFTFVLFPQQIAALRFLHQQGYVHGDVQPKNIAEGAEDIGSDRNDVSFKGRVYLCSRFF